MIVVLASSYGPSILHFLDRESFSKKQMKDNIVSLGLSYKTWEDVYLNFSISKMS